MRSLALATVAVASVLVLPAGAAAQDPPVPAPAPETAPPPAPVPTPAPAPVKAKLSIALQRVGSGGVLAGSRWLVRGTVKPYVEGQTATVRFYRRGKKILARKVTIRRRGANGTFVLGFRTRTPGRVTVRASHRGTAEMATARAALRRVTVYPLYAARGATGLAVRVLQQRLAKLGYVVGRRGLFDDRTARAVMAFRKLTGMARTEVASSQVFGRLARGHGAFRVRFPQHGRHVEANIGKQVLALINGRRVERIYPISSGAPVTPTILGTFRVYMKTYGVNAKGMVHSSYFIRGYAIHGYPSVPPYPASHGCLRVPVPDADAIYSWVRMGTIVDTYY